MSDEEEVIIAFNDVEGTIKALRALLDIWGIPHTCPQCGTTDTKDILPYCCPYVWKCTCGYVFPKKGESEE